MKNMFVAMFLLIAGPVIAEEEKKEIACGEPAKVETILHEKGYSHLLDMKNENGITEQLWSGGRDMVITAEHDKKICVFATASEVTYNPVTLGKILEVFKKSQKDL